MTHMDHEPSRTLETNRGGTLDDVMDLLDGFMSPEKDNEDRRTKNDDLSHPFATNAGYRSPEETSTDRTGITRPSITSKSMFDLMSSYSAKQWSEMRMYIADTHNIGGLPTPSEHLESDKSSFRRVPKAATSDSLEYRTKKEIKKEQKRLRSNSENSVWQFGYDSLAAEYVIQGTKYASIDYLGRKKSLTPRSTLSFTSSIGSSLPSLSSQDFSYKSLPTIINHPLPIPKLAANPILPTPSSIKLFVMTWNMQGKPPPAEDLDVIPVGDYDVIAIGTQECERGITSSMIRNSKKKWQDKLDETIGKQYTMLASHILGALHLAVFAKNGLLPLVSSVATGIGNVLKNKGGIGISFLLGNTSFLFVNAHFAAHMSNVSARNADFHRIDSELPLTSHGGKGHRRASERFDRIFWFGDLNYRINGSKSAVEKLIEDSVWEVLVFNDQLLKSKREGEVFQGFLEGSLLFKPTYKFDTGTNTYDSSQKARVPAWTDRILFKVNEYTDLLQYDSCPNLIYSDHRPVFAKFEVGYQ